MSDKFNKILLKVNENTFLSFCWKNKATMLNCNRLI